MAPRWFLAELVESERTAAGGRLSERFGADTRTFGRLPLAVVRGDSDLREEILGVPGVAAARTAIEDDVKVVDGLDQLLDNAERLDARIGINGNTGLLPEAGAGDVAAYPYLDLSGEKALIDTDPALFLSTRFGRLAAVNLSLGTIPFATYREADPVNVATRVVSRQSVVVTAAGNEGAGDGGEETLSAWAQPPWVVAVGATDREDGGAISADSSRGDPDDPETWPDVVAYGASRLDPKRFGTSFAAPRVTRQVGFLTAFVLALRSFALPQLGAGEEGVPIVWFGFVDKHIDMRPAEPERPLAALPRNVIDEEQLTCAIQTVRESGAALDLWPVPATVRELLFTSAQALPGTLGHEAGHGFVSDDTTHARLLSFSGLDLARLFAGDAASDAAAGRRLEELRFTEDRPARALMSACAGSFGMLAFDVASYEDPISPRALEAPEPRHGEGGAEALSNARAA